MARVPEMNGWKFCHIAAVTAIMLCSAWSIAWLAGWLVAPDTWPVRLGLLCGGLLAAGGVAAMLFRCSCRQQRALERLLDGLARSTEGGSPCSDQGPELPPELRDGRLGDFATRTRDAFDDLRRRLQEAEHVHSALEVRYRRAAAEAERIRSIFFRLADPILVVDDYDELVLANPRAEALLGLELDKAEHRALAGVVRCQKLVDLLLSTSRRKGGGSRHDEIELPGPEGQPQWYRVTATRLAAAGQNEAAGEAGCSGTVAVLRDIGDQKALQKRNAEFVSAVSHEMKTPLAGIKAYVELLVDGDAEDEQTREEFLKVIDGQADRLQRLVENLLNLARIEAGVVKVSKENRSLNELLEEALRVVRPAAEAKRIELGSDLSPMYLGVLADRDMLLQAAINLLSNAIKYTPEGGRVTLRSRLVGTDVRFEVEDTGVGLNEEDCRRVFEKFYRVGKDKNMAAGTGLGLPLAKHIVEDVHGGQLTVESTPGVGSTFAVTLPGAGQMT